MATEMPYPIRMRSNEAQKSVASVPSLHISPSAEIVDCGDGSRLSPFSSEFDTANQIARMTSTPPAPSPMRHRVGISVRMRHSGR